MFLLWSPKGFFGTDGAEVPNFGDNQNSGQPEISQLIAIVATFDVGALGARVARCALAHCGARDKKGTCVFVRTAVRGGKRVGVILGGETPWSVPLKRNTQTPLFSPLFLLPEGNTPTRPRQNAWSVPLNNT